MSHVEQKHKRNATKIKNGGKEGEESAVKTEQTEKKPRDPSKGVNTRKEKLNWPKSNSPEWRMVDDDLTRYLKILIKAINQIHQY